MVFLLAAPTLAACSSSSDTVDTAATEISIDEAKQKAVAIVPGTALGAETIDTADEHRWAVTVQIATGQHVVVELARTGGAFEESRAEAGPFDYDVPAPMPGMMTLAQAKAKALEAKKGTIEIWEFHAAKREYELYVRDVDTRLWEIKMAGDTGVITSVEEKAAAD